MKAVRARSEVLYSKMSYMRQQRAHSQHVQLEHANVGEWQGASITRVEAYTGPTCGGASVDQLGTQHSIISIALSGNQP